MPDEQPSTTAQQSAFPDTSPAVAEQSRVLGSSFPLSDGGQSPVSAALEGSAHAHRTPEQVMQRHSEREEHPVDRINVRLILGETEQIDEELPVDVVRMLLSPVINDCFIRVSNGHKKPPRCKGHYLHTAFIREIMLLDELPPAEGV